MQLHTRARTHAASPTKRTLLPLVLRHLPPYLAPHSTSKITGPALSQNSSTSFELVRKTLSCEPHDAAAAVARQDTESEVARN
jgi:hypothetical protein